MSLYAQAIGQIFDNCADAIEGGNSYRGSGTAYDGIPGTQSNEPALRTGAMASSFTLGASANHSTTQVALPSAQDDDFLDAMVRSNTPPFFVYFGASTSTALLRSNTRKITAYDSSNAYVTVSPALDDTPVSGDTVTILQGFKRLPNDIDPEADHQLGYDRFFRLSATPGSKMSIYGGGNAWYETQLVLRLRLLKYGRDRDIRDSVLENLIMLREGLVRSDNIDTTYIRTIQAEGGSEKTIVDDAHKIVAEVTFVLRYRVATAAA